MRPFSRLERAEAVLVKYPAAFPAALYSLAV